MKDFLKWKTAPNSTFVATLIFNSDEELIPLLIIRKNENCFSSIPTAHIDRFIAPFDVTFEEADLYLKEQYGNLSDDEIEENRLEYALKVFEKNLEYQLNKIPGYV